MIASSQQITQRVREALAAMHEGTRADIAERLGVQTQADLNRVKRAVDGLVKTGEVASIGLNESGEAISPFQPVKYRWVARLVNHRGVVQRKLWKFACHRYGKGQTFSAAEAAGLAGCALDYAKRYCRWLWGTGYLALAARGKAGARLYRVVAEKEREPAPPWNRRAVDGKKARPAAPTPPAGQEHRLETCAAVLAEMRQTLAAISGGAELVMGMVDELEAALGLTSGEQGHGEPTEGHY